MAAADDDPAVPGEADVRAQLKRILCDQAFEASARVKSFLAYVVREKLAGRGDRIKAYTIATDVFGRGASFDAHNDAIVRIEAGHLRRALAAFYATAGAADPVVITVPKGRYVPTFALRGSFNPPIAGRAPELPQPKSKLATKALGIAASILLIATLGLFWMSSRGANPGSPDLPTIAVKTFEDLSTAENASGIAKGLTQEILAQIVKFKDISVFEQGAQLDEAQARSARFLLSGSVTIEADRVRIHARVADRSDGRLIWANNYESKLRATQVLDFERDIAQQVATAIGQPYGVISQADLSGSEKAMPDDWGAYSCSLSYYAYRVNLDAKTHPDVRKCLERAVARFPNYSTGWALLSQTYIDEVRFHYAPDPSESSPSSERALAAARRGIEIDPNNVRALQAEMLALWFSGQQKAALDVGDQAFAINPNDTELAGELGFRKSAAGQWSQGCTLLKQARDRNPGSLGYFEVALALCAYIRKDYAEAAEWIRKTPMPENHNYHLVAAIIFAELGLKDDVARERDWLVGHAPAIIANIRQEVAARYLRAEDRERLIASLIKAGLPVPAEGGPDLAPPSR